MFSTAPVGVLSLWCLRVSPKSVSAHLLCRTQDLLSALGGGLPEVLRSTRRPVQHRSGLAVTKGDGRLGYPKRSRRPSDRAEWTMVLRYGHDVGFTHGVGTAHTPCSLVQLHAPCLGASLDGLLPLQRHANASLWPN